MSRHLQVGDQHVWGSRSTLPVSFQDTLEQLSSQRLQRVVAAVAIVILGLRISLLQGVTLGTLVAIVLSPLWLGTLRHYRGARLLLASAVIALLSGAILTQLSSADHATSGTLLISVSVVVLGVAVGVGVFLWAREVLGEGHVVVYFGAGMLLGVLMDLSPYALNLWKFGLSVPLTVLLLGLAHLWRKRWLEIVIVVVLAGISALRDSRSAFAILLLTALLIGWQMRAQLPGKRGSALRVLVTVAAVAAVVYHLGQALILDGYLGQEAQQRSVAQIDATGSLLVGGRPELAATGALMTYNPWGFGAGTLPSHQDLFVAKSGMASINYDPDNGYVERYMFGEGFELHSTFGDLWANFGIMGLVFNLTMLLVIIRGFATAMAAKTASGVIIFLTAKALWNVPFSPFYSSAPLFMLVLGLILIRRDAANPLDAPAGRDDWSLSSGLR